MHGKTSTKAKLAVAFVVVIVVVVCDNSGALAALPHLGAIEIGGRALVSINAF